MPSSTSNDSNSTAQSPADESRNASAQPTDQPTTDSAPNTNQSENQPTANDTPSTDQPSSQPLANGVPHSNQSGSQPPEDGTPIAGQPHGEQQEKDDEKPVASILEPPTDTTPPSEIIEKQAQEHKNKSIALGAIIVGVVAIVCVTLGWFVIMPGEEGVSSGLQAEVPANAEATAGTDDANNPSAPEGEAASGESGDQPAAEDGEAQTGTEGEAANGEAAPSDGAAPQEGTTPEGEAAPEEENPDAGVPVEGSANDSIGSIDSLTIANPGGVTWSASVHDLPAINELHGVADNGVTIAFMPNDSNPQIDCRILSLQVNGQTYDAGAPDSPVRYTITAGPQGEHDITGDPVFAVGTNGPNGAYGQRLLVSVDGLAEANYNDMVLTVEETPEGGQPVTGTITLTSNTAA